MNNRPTIKILAAAGLAVALLGLAGCGSSEATEDAAPATPKTTPGNPTGAAPAPEQQQLAPAPPMRTDG